MSMNHNAHSVYDIKYHIVWTTKYRWQILEGNFAIELKQIIQQICQDNHITIINSSIASDHIHLLLSCPPTLLIFKIVQLLKGRSSKLLQEAFPSLSKKYSNKHIWARGYFCATVGNVTDYTVKQYIENQKVEEHVQEKVYMSS